MSTINESAIKTPGVYINEIPSFPPSVAQVATAIPAFIGYTQNAENADGDDLTLKPTKIYSLLEYVQNFGKAEDEDGIEVNVTIVSGQITAVKATHASPSNHNMYYALRHFFDNGGGQCYIISVGDTTTAAGTIDDTELLSGLNVLAAYDEPTLIVFPEGQGISDKSKYYALVGSAIDQCATLQDRFTLVDVHTQELTTSTTMTNFRTDFSKTDNLNYAATYYPNLLTTYEYQYQETDVDVIITTDAVPAAGVSMDTLPGAQGAVYFAAKAAIQKLGPTLPPTPAVAGLYAKVDGSRGVWKAPANVSVSYVKELTDFITDAEQETMNIDVDAGKSVNAIRAFVGKGTLVWGARTLDGNSNEWRYVSVRRFFIMVEESTKKATYQFVFEPNDANTWVKIRAMIENYLTVLWRQGALAGAKPEHAFFVKVGLGQTMTALDILEGRLIVEIGMAAVRPAEFIILRFMHKMQES